MVGFFDSGVGGLSVLREVERLMPTLSTVYFADSANFPYGTKSEDEVRQLSLYAVDVLLKYQPSAIVVACNTASTAALESLRQKFPELTFIGVVPAIKPALAWSQKKKIAVLATARTLASPAYVALKREYYNGASVLDQACPGWVELVEAGKFDDTEANTAVRDVIEPLARQGVDAYVLGCTHYPFLRPLIERQAGPSATVLDSGQAVAQQLQRVVGNDAPVNAARREIFITSGDKIEFSELAGRLLGRDISVQ